jgi:hypothetical protein
MVHLYDPKHKIAVIKGPFKDLGSCVPLPEKQHVWFSWSGSLHKGDLVVLLNPKDQYSPNENHFEKEQVVGVAEVLDLDDKPAR